MAHNTLAALLTLCLIAVPSQEEAQEKPKTTKPFPRDFEEIAEVLSRPRFRASGIRPEHVRAVLLLLAPLLPDVEVALPVRDADDLPVLASALAGGVDAIVTGDRDLLDDARLRALLLERGIEVLTPAEMLGRVSSRRSGPSAG